MATLWSMSVSGWRAGFRVPLCSPQGGTEEPANRRSSITVEYNGGHKGWEEEEERMIRKKMRKMHFYLECEAPVGLEGPTDMLCY